MPDALTTITQIINSPPGQLVAGGVLAGIVWKFFERVEAVLTDQTKLEIAVWLVGVKQFGPNVEPWPGTFVKMFDRVFGATYLSRQVFLRSVLASVVMSTLGLGVAVAMSTEGLRFWWTQPWQAWPTVFIGNPNRPLPGMYATAIT